LDAKKRDVKGGFVTAVNRALHPEGPPIKGLTPEGPPIRQFWTPLLARHLLDA
jgi:hypothetical protein